MAEDQEKRTNQSWSSTQRAKPLPTYRWTRPACCGQYLRAMEDLDETIRLDPQLAHAYANRARAYALLGKDKEAQQDVNRAVGLGFDRDMLDGSIEELKKQR